MAFKSSVKSSSAKAEYPVPDESPLTAEDYQAAAKEIGCEVAAIMAVAEVESMRSAFDDGKPTILYERHKFHSFTRGRYAENFPALSNPHRGGYGKYSEQWPKFEQAARLDRSAAIKACSWGKFQIMGFNWAQAGYSNIEGFFEGMFTSEKEQLRAFVNFIVSNGLGYHMKNHRWAAFAKAYNGLLYRQNDYDTKLLAAYEKFVQEV